MNGDGDGVVVVVSRSRVADGAEVVVRRSGVADGAVVVVSRGTVRWWCSGGDESESTVMMVYSGGESRGTVLSV